MAVYAHVVVVLAQQHAVGEGGFAAVGLVSEVVDVAVGGGAAALRPGAVAVAQEDGAADVAGDGVAVADVEGEARGVPGFVQEALSKDRGNASGAGNQIDGETGDGVAQVVAGLGRGA